MQGEIAKCGECKQSTRTMAPDQWVYAAIVVMVLVHLTALVYVRYRGTAVFGAGHDAGDRGPPTGPGDGTGRAGVDPPERVPETTGATITCPRCGATNGAGFRFCWNCIADLPAANAEATPRTDGAVL